MAAALDCIVPSCTCLCEAGYWLAAGLALFWALRFLTKRVFRLWPARRVSLPRGSHVVVVGGGIAGCSAAFALARSGYRVSLVEKEERVGGNAKVHDWPNGVRTGLSVLAWPPKYFRNYEALLDLLGIEREPVTLPFYIRTPRGDFAHASTDLGLNKAYRCDLQRWGRLVALVRWVSTLCNGTDMPSLYHFSVLNPFNLITLRAAVWLAGISTEFYEDVIVPIYSSSFLTTQIDRVPAIILPAIDDLIPLNSKPQMLSWQHDSSLVFRALLRDVQVYTGCVVVAHALCPDGGHRITLSQGTVLDASAVVYACNAQAAAACLPTEHAGTARLLRGVAYADEDCEAFERGFIHSDESVLPADIRERIKAGRFANFVEMSEQAPGQPRRCTNTFIIGSWYRAAYHARSELPMMVTYNRDIPPKGVLGEVRNERNHPHLHLANLTRSLALRFFQGRDHTYFCGSYSTPGNGHDLSLISGFLVARALGADYPLAHVPAAEEDFERLATLTGLF